ncbi:hypothetical protein ACQ4PT_008734 [Festuca glaucescens]
MASKGKVCVTGASGFVASWLVKRLLESGYNVLGTVRDPGNQKKVAHLWNLAGAKERLELVRADLLEEGSFDDAVMACEGVFHTASPIITKSDSKVWYGVAKILAEKSAWEFAKENNIDLVAVLPTFVIGPNLSSELGPTVSDVLGLYKGETEKFTMFGRMGYVHIDDIASCHILVYETANAKGRYICNSAVLNSNELVAFLAKRFPSFPIPKSLLNIYGEQTYGYNTSKIRKLGLEFKGVEEMFDDAVESLKGHGYLLESAE